MTLKKRLSTVNKKRKWATGLGSLLAAVWLLSCTGPVATTPASSPTPIGSPTAEPTPTRTSTPTPTPSPLNCGDDGSLMFAREYSLYMACADGSAEQEIVPAESWLPDESYYLRGFALSPSGNEVAISAKSTGPDEASKLFVIQLDSGSIIQLHHTTRYEIGHIISWSPDGEYIGYMASPGYYDRLEVLHVESRTISQVATAESISGKADWVVNILSFDWSPRGTQIAYVAFLDGKPPEINGYVADIDCTPDHICRGSNQRRLPWVNSWRTLAWSPDGLSLSTGYTENAETSILEIRRPSGELLRRIDLTDLLPGMRIAHNSKTALSPDGNRIAFFMEGDKGVELFVLNLSTLEATKFVRQVNPVDIQWVPGK